MAASTTGSTNGASTAANGMNFTHAFEHYRDKEAAAAGQQAAVQEAAVQEAMTTAADRVASKGDEVTFLRYESDSAEITALHNRHYGYELMNDRED